MNVDLGWEKLLCLSWEVDMGSHSSVSRSRSSQKCQPWWRSRWRGGKATLLSLWFSPAVLPAWKQPSESVILLRSAGLEYIQIGTSIAPTPLESASTSVVLALVIHCSGHPSLTLDPQALVLLTGQQDSLDHCRGSFYTWKISKASLLLVYKGLFVFSYPKVAQGELSRRDGNPQRWLLFQLSPQADIFILEENPILSRSLHAHHKGRMGWGAGKDPKNHSASCQKSPQMYDSHTLWKK